MFSFLGAPGFSSVKWGNNSADFTVLWGFKKALRGCLAHGGVSLTRLQKTVGQKCSSGGDFVLFRPMLGAQ